MSESTDLTGIEFADAQGATRTLRDYAGGPVLIVNVASRCGLTPQYAQLEQLQRDYGPRGLTVLGFPCDQFMGQEPGSIEEILEYCSTTWGVSFPILDKIEVNGEDAHPLYRALTQVPDAEGTAGPVQWNFEKFLVTADGAVTRFRPKVTPDAPEVIEAIEAALPR
ncbi:glutathione peroxidase [Brachybacterium phenoliresistens]|uniref:glutathione peroxidase n=1 Tax=Brachybacterium phenoliresistens TaxID=396014 RepID=UPI0031DDD14B